MRYAKMYKCHQMSSNVKYLALVYSLCFSTHGSMVRLLRLTTPPGTFLCENHPKCLQNPTKNSQNSKANLNHLGVWSDLGKSPNSKGSFPHLSFLNGFQRGQTLLLSALLLGRLCRLLLVASEALARGAGSKVTGSTEQMA